MLELYQFEGCPYCQRVREALDELGLDYVVRTVPRRPDLRDRVYKLSGQWQVPLLVDRERDVVLPESKSVIAYLREHYHRTGPPA